MIFNAGEQTVEKKDTAQKVHLFPQIREQMSGPEIS